MSDRKKELLKNVCKDGDEIKVIKLVDEIVFLEEQLQELRKNNFEKVHPNNPNIRKKDKDAIKQYKEFLQQYTNCLKVLFTLSGESEDTAESPLRQWARSRIAKDNTEG